MANKFSNRSLENLKGVHPDMVRLMHAAIENCPVDFTITEGVRTAQRQQELYAQGRSTIGPKVTNIDGINGRSNHQVKDDGYGYAVDLYPYIDGSVRVDDTESLGIIANHIRAVGSMLNIRFQWGGDWKMRDFPHFELE